MVLFPDSRIGTFAHLLILKEYAGSFFTVLTFEI
jgi:hypothetical protein